MDDRQKWLAEGLHGLVENISQIDYHRLLSGHVIREAQLPPVYSVLKEIPEYMEWREFQAAIIDELNAAVRHCSEHSIELPQCRKLAIALEHGYYRDGDPILLETLAELHAAVASLAGGGGGHVQTVRLSQCAGIVNRSKRTLERWKTKDTDFPTPEVIGEAGKPDEWSWPTIRAYLEQKIKRKLPIRFPTLSR